MLMAPKIFAQTTSRGFSYQSRDAVAGNCGAAADVELQFTARIVVRPYLYVSGILEATWEVDGWGQASHQRSEALRFFHNQAISLSFRQFDDMKKTSGSPSGSKDLSLQGEFVFENGLTGTTLFDTGVLDQNHLSRLSDFLPHVFGVGDTGGLLLLQIQRTVSVSRSAGPGIYENIGSITVVRN